MTGALTERHVFYNSIDVPMSKDLVTPKIWVQAIKNLAAQIEITIVPKYFYQIDNIQANNDKAKEIFVNVVSNLQAYQWKIQ